MKSLLFKILPLTLCLALVLSGCAFGSHQAAQSRPSRAEESTGVTNSNGEVDPNPFTAMVVFNGKPVIPTVENPITVLWSDGYSVHEADLGPDGTAQIGGLDGDYRVTLIGVPEGFTYNPNIYSANNTERNVVIELHQILDTQGKGIDPYKPIMIRNVGIYCVTVTEPGRETYFAFAPTKSGTYNVSSWMDVIANEVNPVGTYWGANPAYKRLLSTHDNGGPEGSYTKNFIMDVEIDDENISHSGGSAQFTFGVSATAKDGKYPINIYIAVTYEGDFEYPHSSGTIMAPTQLPPAPIEGNGTWTWAETYDRGLVFDSDNYKLGPDGYYHKYDPVRYAANNGYGPILYAAINSATRFLEGQSGPISFTQIEYQGNKALTLENGEENYKMFIEGWAYLNHTDMVIPGMGKAPYFCVLDCPCRTAGTCTSAQMGLENGTCETDCPNCAIGCRNLPREYIGALGYIDVCNSDGRAPVTPELKDFLQKFSISQLLFMDGQGFVETHPQYQIFANEDDQWLFACGYYE